VCARFTPAKWGLASSEMIRSILPAGPPLFGNFFCLGFLLQPPPPHALVDAVSTPDDT
jgi:hypothetical protein